MSEPTFQVFLKSKGLRFYIPNAVPNPKTSDIPLALEFREELKDRSIENNPITFEGYICTQLAAYLIEGIEGVITKEKIIDAAQSIKDVDFKGLKLSFNPQTRVLSNTIWIDPGTKEPWKKVDLNMHVARRTPGVNS